MKKISLFLIIFLTAFSAFAQSAEKEESSNYVCSEKSLEIIFPAVNKGKFKYKTRDSETSFGKTFATAQKAFDEKVYLEWQIGYDALVQDVKSGKKQTKLTKEKFLGSNGKEKYPYELSEILYEAIKCGLIASSDLDKLLTEIGTYKKFIDERPIVVEKPVNIALNGIAFKETNIKLPTLLMPHPDGTVIEVSVQKQQYAAGIQPMIYVTIPFKSFADAQNLNGKKSVKGSKLKYIIKKENADIILNTFRVFAMASLRHRFDVEQILKTVKKLV